MKVNIDANSNQRKIEEVLAGTCLKTKSGRYYIRLQQSAHNVVDLETGIPNIIYTGTVVEIFPKAEVVLK